MSQAVSRTDAFVLRSQWNLWIRWTIATAAGELIGFAIPAVFLPLALVIGLSADLLPLAAIVAGAGEGASLGLAQWIVLHRHLPEITRRAWIGATTFGAMFAYAVAMIPTALADFDKLDGAILIAGGSLFGLLFLLSMGLPQSLVLRQQLKHSGWWVLASAVAWPLGVAVPFIGLTAIRDGSPMIVMIGTGVLSGMLMGVVVGAITGVAFIWLLQMNARK
jgi:hypothetical protein